MTASDVNAREIPEVHIVLIGIVVVMASGTSGQASGYIMRLSAWAVTSPKIGSDRILCVSDNEEIRQRESLSIDVCPMLE